MQRYIDPWTYDSYISSIGDEKVVELEEDKMDMVPKVQEFRWTRPQTNNQRDMTPGEGVSEPAGEETNKLEEPDFLERIEQSKKMKELQIYLKELKLRCLKKE
jgi:hypothetical protein